MWPVSTLLTVVSQNIFVELHDKHEDAFQNIMKMWTIIISFLN